MSRTSMLLLPHRGHHVPMAGSSKPVSLRKNLVPQWSHLTVNLLMTAPLIDADARSG
jgi:hypothetical protein